ncbi:MAG: PilZ domain-containing protein [Gammaproteobacteria bacterium]|nr:PilZ domain-containing protein [Gammaproteobacteria bacterium]
MIKEQRLTTRHSSDSGLHFSIPGTDTQFEGECINISNNGILISSKSPVNPGHVISICLNNETMASPPLNILAKTIWSKQQPSGYCHIGASIKVVMAANDVNNV